MHSQARWVRKQAHKEEHVGTWRFGCLAPTLKSACLLHIFAMSGRMTASAHCHELSCMRVHPVMLRFEEPGALPEPRIIVAGIASSLVARGLAGGWAGGLGTREGPGRRRTPWHVGFQRKTARSCCEYARWFWKCAFPLGNKQQLRYNYASQCRRYKKNQGKMKRSCWRSCW